MEWVGILEVAWALRPENFEEFHGQEITVSQAARRVGVDPSTILRWAGDGCVRVLGHRLVPRRGKPALVLDLADVERVRRLLELSPHRQGRSVFPGRGSYVSNRKRPLLERLKRSARTRGE